jgi:hypothetical protein
MPLKVPASLTTSETVSKYNSKRPPIENRSVALNWRVENPNRQADQPAGGSVITFQNTELRTHRSESPPDEEAGRENRLEQNSFVGVRVAKSKS